MSDKKMFVFIGVYNSKEEAEADYDVLKELHRQTHSLAENIEPPEQASGRDGDRDEGLPVKKKKARGSSSGRPAKASDQQPP